MCRNVYVQKNAILLEGDLGEDDKMEDLIASHPIHVRKKMESSIWNRGQVTLQNMAQFHAANVVIRGIVDGCRAFEKHHLPLDHDDSSVISEDTCEVNDRFR